MLYAFKDTVGVSEGVTLPSEAMQINGEYIENVIVGYRTLQVSGRESLAPELDLLETAQDGARIKNKRYPARAITVKYQLCTESPEAFRQAYNDLGRILNCENAELIFNDEKDKFFIGTPYKLGEVPPGQNNVVSTFEILCVDPFKYSCIEYEATPALEESSILIDYQGTHRAYPILQADMYNESEENADSLTGKGDCGFVAFFNENEKIVQLGDPEEKDGVTEDLPSQTLINNTFTAANSWSGVQASQWNVGTGTVAMGVAAYAPANQYYGNKKQTYTNCTLFDGYADSGEPMFRYKVVAKASNRAANSVRVNVSITASLTRASSYFGRGYGLKASLYINNKWHPVTLKGATSYWRGLTGHTVNLAFTVDGLTTTATSIGGIRFKVERTDSLTDGHGGVLSAKNCNNLAILPYESKVADKYYLKAVNYGTGTGWHGAGIVRNIPVDSYKEAGAKNWTVTFCNKLSIGSGSAAASQLGGFSVYLRDKNNMNILSINIAKSAAGKTAKVSVMNFAGGKSSSLLSSDIDVAYNNSNFTDGKQQYIRKQGDLLTLKIGGFNKSYRLSALKDIVVNSVMLTFNQYGSSPTLEHNGLFWFKFVKDYHDVWRDIPNKFSAGDVVEANCRNGEILLNGVSAPELGAIGNNWESFYLNPGLNQIGLAFSEWLTGDYIPACKVRYREVFL